MAALRRCLSPLGAHPGNFTQPFAWRRLIATTPCAGDTAARRRRAPRNQDDAGMSGHVKPTAGSRHRIHSTLPLETEEVDVAVVGCGSAGLLAAATLANRGFNVHCFDAHYVAGGCATQFGRTVKTGPHPGLYRFDVGLHYIGDLAEFHKLLAGAGVELQAAYNYAIDNISNPLPQAGRDESGPADRPVVVLEQMDPQGYDTLVFPDFSFAIPDSLDAYRDNLVALFPSPGDGAAIDAYMRLLREVEAMTSSMAHARGKGVIGALGVAWNLATSGRLLAKWQNATLGAFLDEYTDNMQLKAVISGQNGDYGIPPGDVSVMLHCGLALHYFRDGGFYPRGGGQAISDALAASVERNGGTVHLRRPVRRIVVDPITGAAQGVQLEPRGDTPPPMVKAKVVLSAADLEHTLTSLLDTDALKPEEAAKVDKTVGSFVNAEGLFMTCLGLAHTPDQLRQFGFGARNYWCFDNYNFDQAYADVRSGKTLDAFGAYITSAGLKDPTVPHSPPGTSNVEVLTVCSGVPEHWGVTPEQAFGPKRAYRKAEQYLERKAGLQDGMIARLERQFPGVTGADTGDTDSPIVFAESTTPFSHHRFTHGGSAYGLAATPHQFMRHRVGHVPPAAVDNLYLCGHSTRSGHGVSGAMMGGAKAAHVITKKLTSSA